MNKALNKFAGFFHDNMEETKAKNKDKKIEAAARANEERYTNKARNSAAITASGGAAGAIAGAIAGGKGRRGKEALAGMAAGGLLGAGLSTVYSAAGGLKNIKIEESRRSLGRDVETNKDAKRKIYPRD